MICIVPKTCSPSIKTITLRQNPPQKNKKHIINIAPPWSILHVLCRHGKSLAQRHVQLIEGILQPGMWAEAAQMMSWLLDLLATLW